ncbi:MAG: hypothetical protein KI790_15710, partial [Cyclobacteriaceae bacterium]|nr:hypothetical protein [Cyclobacteriaceae bacterium HetDA_MAG_MS6]
GLGFLVGVINAITERADTRNWQTLPHSIYYTRVPLKTGENKVILNTVDLEGQPAQEYFSFEGSQGQIVFHAFQSL